MSTQQDAPMDEIDREQQLVTIDLGRLIAVARRLRNLAPAFDRAVARNREAEERLQDEWSGWEDTYEYGSGERYLDPDQVFGLVDRTPTGLLSLVWNWCGPCSSDVSYYAVEDVAGWNIVYRSDDDGLDGLPIVAMARVTTERLQETIVRGLRRELGDPQLFNIPDWIELYDADLFPVVARALWQCFETGNQWPALRREIVEDTLYPDHLNRCMTELKAFVHAGSAGETPEERFQLAGEWLDRQRDPASDGPEVPITEQDKVRLLEEYLRRKLVCE